MKDELKDKTVGELRKMNVSLSDIGIDESLFENLRLTFIKIDESLKKAMEPFRKTLEVISKRNPIFIDEDWYLSEYIFRKLKFLKMYNITPESLEKELVSLYQVESNSLKERLIKNHKEREIIITELFNSFKKKHYHSVILLSYSVTDGISNEKFGHNFWGYNHEQNSTKSSQIALRIESESIFDILKKQLVNRGELSQMRTQIPIEKRSESYNRHCVIHGESYLYGTKTNAIKSIFLLDFISSLNNKD